MVTAARAAEGAPATAAVVTIDNENTWAGNATSHPTEIALLRELLDGDPRFAITTLEIGKGELVATRTS